MDYYQGVVTDYLRADRAMFVNTECCIQLDEGDNPDKFPGRHWYCDAVAVNFRDRAVFLCEITYSSTQDALVKRLKAWHSHWDELRFALIRDLHVPKDWNVRPWAFIPEACHAVLERKLVPLAFEGTGSDGMPLPRVTFLESVAPWKYRSWNHVHPAD